MQDPFPPGAEPRPLLLTPSERESVCRAGSLRGYPAGETIFKRGDAGDIVYFLRHGWVEIQFPEGMPSKHLGPGEFFGELSLVVGSHVRTATAIAREASDLQLLDPAAIDTLLASEPRLLFSLVRASCFYLLASEQRLVASLKDQNRELVQALDYLRRTRQDLDRQELLAQTDELTGLYNRRCLQSQLGAFLDRASRRGRGLAIVALDLDGFKLANDTYGHAFGDRVLQQVAHIITGCVRSQDLPCRTGGDEFLVVLFDIEEDQAHALAERLRHRIAAHAFDPGSGMAPATITASLGVAHYSVAESADEILERADHGLYRAKNEGKNRVSTASADAVARASQIGEGTNV
ncbi:MAG: GGDEF domain-containing protein [Acidobacteriota bacterium]